MRKPRFGFRLIFRLACVAIAGVMLQIFDGFAQMQPQVSEFIEKKISEATNQTV